ncbi:UDP-galactopyranose mutase [Spirochaetia bacterium]|nr:UDP-galactopyranose mutase [Spirochaetia bacterium]
MSNYDYLIVGSGLFGSVMAHELKKKKKKILVIEKRAQPGGNIYCEKIEDINVHTYGAHIFHTNNKEVWDFVNSFVSFNNYINSPIANYKGKFYNLPFNMNTFYSLWGVTSPQAAREMIKKQQGEAGIHKSENLEEQAISLVGRDIYETLIKGYTEKQWGRKCTDLPPFIIKRLPVRFTFDNNYFNDRYQGIPIGGYNTLTEKLLTGIETLTNTDFFKDRTYFQSIAKNIIFTGRIDEFYNYEFGKLEYRSLKFETEILDCENYQGNAVINFTDYNTPYTRIIEHKHFEFGTQAKTVISREYPAEWREGTEPFYPINDKANDELHKRYYELTLKEKNVMFGGRLAEYKYYDMDKVIEIALSKAEQLHAKN